MRSFKIHLNYSRVLIFVVALLISGELAFRAGIFYSWGSSEHFLEKVNGWAVEVAMDMVRTHAKAGDWILLGDSILKGIHSPPEETPAGLIRAKIGKDYTVWDLTLPGANPVVEAALLARLGPLPGVYVIADVSQKLCATHVYMQQYWAEIWEHLAGWETTPQELKKVLDELTESYFQSYGDKEQKTYGESVAEKRLEVWANAHIGLTNLDFWFRQIFYYSQWPEPINRILMGGFHFTIKKPGDFGFQTKDDPHVDFDYSDKAQDYLKYWFGRKMTSGEPNWRAYLIFLDMMKARGKFGIVSPMSISIPRTRKMKPEYGKPIEEAYLQFRDAAVAVGAQIVEPSQFVEDEGYVDEDHLHASGNKAWVDAVLKTAGM